MQFLVIGIDGKDEGAKERRLKARLKHIYIGNGLLEKGNFWFGAALTDDQGEMIGSALIMNFPSRKALDEWLAVEPYVTEKVWESIEIKPCNVRDPWQFSKPREFYEKQA